MLQVHNHNSINNSWKFQIDGYLLHLHSIKILNIVAEILSLLLRLLAEDRVSIVIQVTIIVHEEYILLDGLNGVVLSGLDFGSKHTQ